MTRLRSVRETGQERRVSLWRAAIFWATAWSRSLEIEKRRWDVIAMCADYEQWADT
jgi:hypothetical protein